MATQRTRVSGRNGNRKWSLRFSLDVFERDLRKALKVESNRPCGTPGGGDLPIPGELRSAAKLYLVDNILSKYDDGKSGPDKANRAYEKFFVAEEVCFWRNLFFSQDYHWIGKTYPALAKAREIIHDLLTPELDLDRVARGFNWGPGASTRLSRLAGDACYKYSGPPEVTPNAYAAGVAAIEANPLWKQSPELSRGPTSVWGSRLTTVPKNYKIDRCIAIEPDLNMYLQKGYGSYLRQKLKTVGIDLDTQVHNQVGTKDSSLATIDFSMASDSVSQGLVSYLLPWAHVEFVTMSRSELCVLPDKSLYRLNKVSSMGNGYTFELETLIFWALAVAVVGSEQKHRVLVYGDDVLLPCDKAESYLEVASVAGFTPNRSKSFWSGPFRESCGIHTHSGHDISPFFIRRPVKKLEDLFLVHNNLVRWIKRVDHLLTREEYDDLQALALKLRNLAPSKWRRPRLPDGYGDGAFIGSFAACCPQPNKDGWEYFTIQVLEETAQVVETEVPGLLVKSLTNLHKRRRVMPRVWEPTFQALPSSGSGRRRVRQICVPWSAFG